MMHVLLRWLHIHARRLHFVFEIKFKCLIYLSVFILVALVSLFYYSKITSANSILDHHAKDTLEKHKQLPRIVSKQQEHVVVQIDQKVLLWIEEIEKRDKTPKGPIITEGIGNYTCHKAAVKKHRIEDLLCMSPPKFLPKYKNPCWNSDNGKFRCLPYFQIIGMDKSGSTDLFDKIANHPDILKNSGALEKETMWWSWKRYGHWLTSKIAVETFDRYLKYFEKASVTIKSRPNASLITGDGTPMDLWDMSGWTDIPQNAGLKDPVFITPHLIKHMNPNVKLVIILRNPVDRLFSDYFFLKIGKPTLSAFHAHVLKSVKLLYDCTRKSTLRTCLYSRRLHQLSRARIHLGFYSVFLRDWFKVFPRNQFLILRTEDYAENPTENLQKAFSFLKLRNLSKADVQKLASAKRKHVTAAKKEAGKMLNETRVILERLYKSYNAELADILNDQRFTWT